VNPKMSIQSLATEETEKEGSVVVAEVFAAERNDRFLEQIVGRISIEPDVTSVRWERTQGQGKRIKTPVHYWLFSSQGQVGYE
jgi:hypothetical protein